MASPPSPQFVKKNAEKRLISQAQTIKMHFFFKKSTIFFGHVRKKQ